MVVILTLLSHLQNSDDDDLKKALELSKKEEQDRLKTVEKYNELSLTEDWEANSKYVHVVGWFSSIANFVLTPPSYLYSNIDLSTSTRNETMVIFLAMTLADK